MSNLTDPVPAQYKMLMSLTPIYFYIWPDYHCNPPFFFRFHPDMEVAYESHALTWVENTLKQERKQWLILIIIILLPGDN